MAFSEIMGFKNLYFHLIFTKFQNFHRNWVKISLQVCENSYSPTCKLDFSQKWWEICNFVKIWWKTKFPNHMISENVTFKVPFTKIKWPKNREDISQPFIEYFFTTHSILLGKIKSFIMIFFLICFFLSFKKIWIIFFNTFGFHSALF